MQLWWGDFRRRRQRAFEEFAVPLRGRWSRSDRRAISLLGEWRGLNSVILVKDSVEEWVGLLAGGGGSAVGRRRWQKRGGLRCLGDL